MSERMRSQTGYQNSHHMMKEVNIDQRCPYRINFVSGVVCYQKADPILTRSIRVPVRTRFVRVNFLPVPNELDPVDKKTITELVTLL